MSSLINVAGYEITPAQLVVGAVGLVVCYILLAPPKVKKPKNPPINKPDDLSVYTPQKDGKYYAIRHDSCMDPLLSKKGIASRPPGIVMKLFKKAATEKPNRLALEANDGKTWTWREYYDDTLCAARSMVSLGFKQFDTVSLIGFNAPQWVIGNMAAIAAGGKAAGIYTTNAADAVEYIVTHSESKIAIVENQEQLDKFLVNIKKLPLLKAIIMYNGKPSVSEAGSCKIMDWDSFMKLGAGKPNDEVDARIANTKAGHCAILIYTSGTTGNPKACMISNDAILFEAAVVMQLNPQIGEKKEDEEHIISYLPLSHIAGQMVDIFAPLIITSELAGSCCLHFADANALKGTLGDSLRRFRPTLFLGVPRVWEKIQEIMKSKGAKSGLKFHLANWAKAVGTEKAKNAQLGGSGVIPGQYGLANALIYKTIKKALGLDRCKFAMTGAAPITREVLTYFGSLGLQINEVYGMSESCGATTFSTDATHIWSSCGFALPGTEVKVDHVKERGDKPGEGELCYRGRHIMMGYLKDELKTKEAIDDQGWLHSGDVGRKDSFGMFYITGRLKELIVSAGGEKYPPIPCEDMMKKNCPAIANVMMVGDKRKYNVLLVCLKSKIDKDGNPLGELDGEALDVDKSCTTVAQAQKSKIWADYIKKGMDIYNSSATSNAHKVQYHTILSKDFSVNGGELTATLKLKRSVVMELYKKEIDSMYKD